MHILANSARLVHIQLLVQLVINARQMVSNGMQTPLTKRTLAQLSGGAVLPIVEVEYKTRLSDGDVVFFCLHALSFAIQINITRRISQSIVNGNGIGKR